MKSRKTAWAAIAVCCCLGWAAEVHGQVKPLSPRERLAIRQAKTDSLHPIGWHLQDPETDGIYGVAANRAYEYLQGREPKERVIVAIIDGGGDVNHEDIRESLWTNPGEIAGNGIDDDHNGYADDIHGWNFMGMPNREQVTTSSMEVDREYVRLTNYFREADTTHLSRKEREEYAYYKNVIIPQSDIHRSVRRRNVYEMKWKQVETSMEKRAAIGDDMEKENDRHYGNNNLFDKGSSAHGQHVAGIVGATRGNGIGMDGVADVQLMMIRVNARGGDEQDKDVASAIRYAVDNGAKVINMSFGKPFSPHSDWVYRAMRYAEKHDVVVVHAAGNNSECIDTIAVYPEDHLPGKKPFRNVITVGSNQPNGEPSIFSNYGHSAVDVFAPGSYIYSTVPGGKAPKTRYQRQSGTSMAAPVVAGVAALIRNYFPELSAKEVKEIILETVTPRQGVMVTPPVSRRQLVWREKMAKVDFATLCCTGGIVNAYEAVKLADERVNGRK